MAKTMTLEPREQQPLHEFTERAYLDYSMYVILDRALPHIADGLKPVQRRIVYAMSELGLNAGAKYKKSARTVGDVLGKFHPHSDTACYEAMVLMAQAFSYRYPMIDGQGNWGSADDPKSFAAMRYTEAKLTAYSQVLLRELAAGTVDWIPNFDGTLEEPHILPAELPNILLNGSTGIAVGMATDIPSHNLREVVAATVFLLDNPKATIKEICQHLPAPDFATAAEIITPKAELIDVYTKGGGSLKQRGTYVEEDGEIVITALPYQVSGAKVLTQIADQMQAKKLPMVVDLRDESDHENPTRLVIVPRSNRVDIPALMSHLFVTTDLERSYRVNLNMIGLNGKPEVKDLKMILSEWLTFRKATVTKRLEHRLNRINARLHILQGLLTVYLHIDEVIRIIRQSDEPKPALMKKFKLTEIQADAILEIKLRQLAKLEEIKLRGEADELGKEKTDIEAILASKAKLNTLIRKELQTLAKHLGDNRRSPLVTREEAKVLAVETRVSADPVTVVLSQQGWIRAAKGHEVDGQSLSYKAGDGFLLQIQAKSQQSIMLFDTSGRCYTLAIANLPSARGQGEPVTSHVTAPSGVRFVGMVLLNEAEEKILLASSAGYGFITPLNDLVSRNRSGKQILTVPAGAEAIAPVVLAENDARAAVVSEEGRLLIFGLDELPILPKGKGNKLMQLDSSKDRITRVALFPAKTPLTLTAGKKRFALTKAVEPDYCGERGKRGGKLPKGFTGENTVVVREG